MSSTILLSEGFERALESKNLKLDVWDFQEVVNQFEIQVTRFRDIMGMAAENMDRTSKGLTIAYDEKAFCEI